MPECQDTRGITNIPEVICLGEHGKLAPQMISHFSFWSFPFLIRHYLPIFDRVCKLATRTPVSTTPKKQ